MYIYGLRCPLTEQFRYVGFTKNPERRFREHLKRDKNASMFKRIWLDSLEAKGLTPELIVLEKLNGEDPHVVELRWIRALHRQGHKLLNGTSGPNRIGRHGSRFTKGALKAVLRHVALDGEAI